MQTIENRLVYGTLAGIYSNLHPVLFRVVTLLGGSTAAGQNYLAQFAGDHIASRKANLKEATDNGPTDMITKFLHAHAEDPSKFTTYDATMIALNNIAAGENLGSFIVQPNVLTCIQDLTPQRYRCQVSYTTCTEIRPL